MNYGWFATVVSIIVLVMTVALLFFMRPLLRGLESEDRTVRARWRRRMFRVVGVWQFAIGILLVAMDSWINSIGLFIMGIFMLLLSRLSEAWLP